MYIYTLDYLHEVIIINVMVILIMQNKSYGICVSHFDLSMEILGFFFFRGSENFYSPIDFGNILWFRGHNFFYSFFFVNLMHINVSSSDKYNDIDPICLIWVSRIVRIYFFFSKHKNSSKHK